MEEIATSLVVFGRGSLLKTLFDRRVSVKGKSIGVKSISFPNLQSQPIRFKVRIQDRRGDVHTILLPPNRWVRSDDLIFAIFEGLNDLFESLDTSNQQTYIINRENLDDGITDYTDMTKPRFKSNMSYGTFATSIFYGDSGLKIIRARSRSPHDDVFTLLKEDALISSDGDRFAHSLHELNKPENSQDKESTITESVYVFCDAIKPSYVGEVKKSLLDVVDMTFFGDNASYFSNSNIQFHKFAVDELVQINFTLQSIDGVSVNFDNPVVIHLSIK